MKVKIFKNWLLNDIDDMEDDINNFIEGTKVIDIKFTTGDSYSFAMVMYEEKR